MKKLTICRLEGLRGRAWRVAKWTKISKIVIFFQTDVWFWADTRWLWIQLRNHLQKYLEASIKFTWGQRGQGVAHEGWQNGAKWPKCHWAEKWINMQRKRWKKIKWFWIQLWIPLPKCLGPSTILPWGVRGWGVAHEGWPNGANWLISWSAS